MSALPPEADMLIVGINVCYVPLADIGSAGIDRVSRVEADKKESPAAGRREGAPGLTWQRAGLLNRAYRSAPWTKLP
jgi:hypothetical protein